MKDKLYYSFDDELAMSSSYNLENKKIEIHFDGYYHLERSEYIEGSSVFKVENWKEAKGSINTDKREYRLDQCMGIISMILHMELREDILDMLVDTVDGRILSLSFQNPILTLKSPID